jgi:hypothetical protein|nr:MAG TPA: hypothetical protein [Caudoviricetes sp.]DAV44149.1 MAG TPA: hypothetical protein [Caudoviricetes sp.]DAZ69425.1 MAG TPA: hypothetical protein [Caudoviricetes sp.]
MGRLIDADKLKHAIHCAYSDDLEILEKIDEQPTAFDAEKVTESLMDRFRVVSNDEDLEWNRAIDYAVKIVEGGGAE